MIRYFFHTGPVKYVATQRRPGFDLLSKTTLSEDLLQSEGVGVEKISEIPQPLTNAGSSRLGQIICRKMKKRSMPRF